MTPPSLSHRWRRLAALGSVIAVASQPAGAATPTAAGKGTAGAGDLGQAICKAIGVAQDTRWFEGRTDLDGDGHDEALAYVAGPQVCGTGGCSLFVFTPEDGGWRLVGEVAVTRPPIRVTDERHHGWRSLRVQVSGGGGRAGEVQLDFDGKTYPGNASVAPARRASHPSGGPPLIADFQDFREGRPVPAGDGCR